jgi:YVTN family beta-propeller protein
MLPFLAFGFLATGGWAAAQEAATVWVVNRDGGDSVSVIDAATNNLIATIPVGDTPHFINFTPDGRQAWVPHQDATYVDAKDGTYIQVHIFLVQNKKENGGLYYYSGSHREPKLPYEYRRSWREEFDEDGISRPGWLIKNIPPQYPKVDIVGPKGGVCFQHGNVIHGSYPNLTRDRDRCQYSIAYLNEGEFYRKGEASIKIPLSLG